MNLESSKTKRTKARVICNPASGGGELVGDEQVEFEVVPRALEVVVEEGYVAEPGG